MTQTILVRESVLGNPDSHEFTLEVPAEQVTVRELIRSRVYQEVKDLNLKANARARAPRYSGLVEIPEAEQILNGSKDSDSKRKPIDWQPHFKKAIEAFEQKQFLILVNEKQAETLDQQFQVQADTVVSFVRLTPLAGG